MGLEGRGARRRREKMCIGHTLCCELCRQLTAFRGQSRCETTAEVKIVGLHWVERFFKESHKSQRGICFPERLQTLFASLK